LDSDSPFKSRGGPARLVGALRYSFSGIRAAIGGEAAFRQELALCAVAVPLALWLPVTPLERLLMIGALGMVLVVELVNSAIEATVDRIGPERHPLSKQAKDLGSAAVMLSLTMAGATWLTVLWPVIRAWLR
jgi:diacylglycerol kinase (ATP)